MEYEFIRKHETSCGNVNAPLSTRVGLLTFALNCIFEGEFKDDFIDGYGSFHFANGAVYW